MEAIGTSRAHVTTAVHLKANASAKAENLSVLDNTVVVVRIGEDLSLFIKDQESIDNIWTALGKASQMIDHAERPNAPEPCTTCGYLPGFSSVDHDTFVADWSFCTPHAYVTTG